MPKKQNKTNRIFFAFLLLAGGAYLLTRTQISFLDTFMFSINFMIYIGLLLFWMFSVQRRLLPTRARSYTIAAAMLMMTELLIRVLRFRILTDIAARRYVDYSYNIPLILIPTLFLMVCIRIRRGESESQAGRDLFLLVPAGIQLILILTNDLNQLFYRRLIPLSDFQGVVGTYTYGPLYYFMYGWIGITMLAGFFILIRRTWRQNIPGLIGFLSILLIWAGLSLINRFVFTPLNLVRMYHAPEIHVFCMLGCFEICIRNRLIPYNENYTGFFSSLDLPVLITDGSLSPVYETKLPVRASDEQLSAAVSSPVYLDEDTLLSGMKLRPGYAFWTEDESKLHRESRRLEEANEILSEENDLIAVENELREKKAHLDAQKQVYNRIAAALYPKQKRIEMLLAETVPETAAFRSALAECCVLNAYCKRKSNLLLLSEENLPQPNRELFLALQESARYLKCCGIAADATGKEYADFSLAQIHGLYDSFETLTEAFLPHLHRMTVSLAPAGIRIALEADLPASLPETALPAESKESDGCVFLTILAEGGNGA